MVMWVVQKKKNLNGYVLLNWVKSAWFEEHGASKFIFTLVHNLDWAGPDYIHVITNSINEITNKKKNKKIPPRKLSLFTSILLLSFLIEFYVTNPTQKTVSV